jgi:hypothetical protein
MAAIVAGSATGAKQEPVKADRTMTAITMQIERVDIETLRPDSANPRRISGGGAGPILGGFRRPGAAPASRVRWQIRVGRGQR